MAETSHTNPYTGESTGQLFSRGPIVAADGGEAEAVPDTDGDDPSRETTPMKDVSHTPPRDADDANAVFERGGTEVGADE
ncbi:hypothetical protein [Natronosalvus rutilus]|uniref:Uncharacterized protein n=1 Tax=Natronosalvus rutilus TaxID=2953753 RepID=A0A9E7NC08_9EURY|nr:hypothetical protein [Natronosalvus rutilus]UTF55125.1 hypothetical protein NGM29_07705 [Natronosalvus rutilus]